MRRKKRGRSGDAVITTFQKLIPNVGRDYTCSLKYITHCIELAIRCNSCIRIHHHFRELEIAILAGALFYHVIAPI